VSRITKARKTDCAECRKAYRDSSPKIQGFYGLNVAQRAHLAGELFRALDGQEWNADMWQTVALVFERYGIRFRGPDKEQAV
jgi:hypothetical protein